ncbi:MAG TPA: nuclear transport factor 2 family protein [Flavobacteriales bacterium]|nr:nuclear transport factor 2 family protein [Flavobacteriales bacterium]HNU58146.1 nuclear transport factor 2 family protein [Flavobacteriales bacterium]
MKWSPGSCALPLIVILIHGCGGASEPATDEAAIRKVMAGQEAAWDRGDLSGFMDGYDDRVCFIGRKGMTCGRDAVTRNYEKSYPDQAAMGDLRFTIHEVLPAGTGHAWVTGNWQLTRTSDTLGGGFSLLWKREKAGWRIIRDHSY